MRTQCVEVNAPLLNQYPRLAQAVEQLSYGLAIVLIFIGLKMLIIDLYKIPITWSLSFTALTLVLTMVLSSVIPSRGSSGGAYPFSARPSSRSTEEPR